jgi:hypothetical protein
MRKAIHTTGQNKRFRLSLFYFASNIVHHFVSFSVPRFFLSRNLRSRPEHKYGVKAVLIYRFAAIKIETICPFKVGMVEFDVGLVETSHLENVHRARKNSIQHKICKWFLSQLKAWKSEIIR